MTTPNILLGYTKPTVTSPDVSMYVENIPEIRSSIHLTLFISLEPCVSLPSVITSNLECTELADVTVKLLLIEKI